MSFISRFLLRIVMLGNAGMMAGAPALAAPLPVTPDNFPRAETHTYFAKVVKDGGLGRFRHHRQLLPPEYTAVVRPNRDTIYSSAVFDLDAGPVTITLPDAGTRFRSVMALDEDAHVPFVAYGNGPYTLTREQVGTRYVLVAIRTLVDDTPADLRAVHALQDGITVQQKAPGRFEVPDWDQGSLAKVRRALTQLGDHLPDTRNAFGPRGQVSPVRHLIATAIAWGGNPDKDALYLTVTPRQNDGSTPHRLHVRDVPVDGFWSISVYNGNGHFVPNPQGAYSLNNLTAKKNTDGSVTVQFGDCARKAPNCLPIMPGWTYTVRLYKPREEILKGQWQFPEAQPVGATVATAAYDPAAIQGAVSAAVWATPLVRFDAMREAYFRDGGARYSDILYWSRPSDWKNQTPTPNASSLYAYANYNVKDGPVVVEIPRTEGATLFGSLLDAWQVPHADVGPEGEDKGNGARYLLLPPGYQGEVPAGYLPVRLTTFNGYTLLRISPLSASASDMEKASGLIRKIRIYPLAQSANPPAQRFIDMEGKLFDGLLRYDASLYRRLARMLAEETTATLPPGIADILAGTMGIHPGTAFHPDTATETMLATAAQQVHAQQNERFREDIQRYWPGRQWGTTAAGALGRKSGFTFQTEQGLNVEARSLFYSVAYAPPARLGKATFYVGTVRDSAGQLLRGGNSYRLRIPPNVPANDYWAVTVYDAQTAGFLRKSSRINVDSYDNGLQRNADGSIDVYFGPRPPSDKTANWIQTVEGKDWFVFFRFYGPRAAVFDKSWVLNDIEPQ